MAHLKRQGVLVGEITSNAAARSAIAYLQHSRTDRRIAGVGIVPGQGQRAAPRLHQYTRPANRSGKGHRVAPIKRQGSVVGDISDDASSRSTVANLKRASANACAAAVGIGTS